MRGRNFSPRPLYSGGEGLGVRVMTPLVVEHSLCKGRCPPSPPAPLPREYRRERGVTGHRPLQLRGAATAIPTVRARSCSTVDTTSPSRTQPPTIAVRITAGRPLA